MSDELVGIEIKVDWDRLSRDRELLRLFNPQLNRKLLAGLRLAVQPVATKAGARMGALQQYYSDSPGAAESYKITLRGDGVQIRNVTFGANVVENWRAFRSSQGEHLIGTLNGRYGQPGRVLWQAWKSERAVVEAGIARVVTAAEVELNAELNA